MRAFIREVLDGVGEAVGQQPCWAFVAWVSFWGSAGMIAAALVLP